MHLHEQIVPTKGYFEMAHISLQRYERLKKDLEVESDLCKSYEKAMQEIKKIVTGSTCWTSEKTFDEQLNDLVEIIRNLKKE